ncbi:MAG: DNA polymerase-3 subunit epsilon [Alphaproteobacteria bacterium]|jgi:DNA polymerase-3 subunit epsilon
MSKLIEIVFDTETTGFEPKTGDKIVEIGALRIYDKMRTDDPRDTFHVLLNPERNIPDEVVKIHGITNDKVKDAPTFAGIVDDFLAFVGDAPLVAHNASFDMKFLNAELEQIDRSALSNKVVDTLAIARRKFPGSRATLDALCNRFEVDLSVRVFHGALLDSQLLADVYLHLSGGLQHGLSLASADTTSSKGVKVDLLSLVGDVKVPRVYPVSENELEIHASFTEKIGANLWFDKNESDDNPQ